MKPLPKLPISRIAILAVGIGLAVGVVRLGRSHGHAAGGDVAQVGCGGVAEEAEVGSTSSAIVDVGNQTITSLCIEVSDKDNAQTTNDVNLGYLTNGDDYWSCTLTGGAARGSTTCCTPTRTSQSNGNIFGLEYFYVKFDSSSSTDGLRVGGIKAVTSSGTTIHYGTFSNADDDVDYADCATNMHCASFWIDGDGHNNCWEVKLWLQAYGSSEVYCINK